MLVAWIAKKMSVVLKRKQLQRSNKISGLPSPLGCAARTRVWIITRARVHTTEEIPAIVGETEVTTEDAVKVPDRRVQTRIGCLR